LEGDDLCQKRKKRTKAIHKKRLLSPKSIKEIAFFGFTDLITYPFLDEWSSK
jgi:hypothetical protein